jgi:hypothetical protein
MDLDAYRARAEVFLAELTGEYRRHYAGLHSDYAIEPIYARHAELFSPDAVDSLRQAAEASAGEHRRGVRMLLDFAVEGNVAEATKEIDAELARREAVLTIEVGGEKLGFRESAVVQANEPNAERRAEIERARHDATELELNPLYREGHRLRHAAAVGLGSPSYAALCGEVKQIDLAGLSAQTAAFVKATDGTYFEILEPELRRTVGIGTEQLRRSDLPRFFRAADLDRWFPPDALIPSLVETLAGGGIDVAGQPGVELDVESRPSKSPRAFCAAVHVPGEVHLVISPTGGRDDFAALFHEAGHTEHYAHVDPALAFEFRTLGDNAITECYAFLLQHLTEDPAWLARRLGVPDADARRIRAHGRAERLVYLRRYAGKLAYELELHSGEGEAGALADRYAALLGATVGVDWPTETYLADVDPGFYCACYLRAWALETHLRGWLLDRFGPVWFEQRAAWDALRTLWREGQRPSPEELLADLTGSARLDFQVMGADLGV